MEVVLPIYNSTGGFLGEQVNPTRIINMYPAPVDGVNSHVLAMIPGSEVAYTHTGGDRTRLVYRNLDTLFAVYNDEVILHDTALNATSLGTLNTSAGYIGVSSNNSQQITFVDNVEGWVYDYSGMSPTFTQITDPDFFSQPVDTAFLDGYTIIAQSSSNRWQISDINDSTSYDALNFARLTSEQDFLVGVRVVNRRIFLFGNQITEIFYNSENLSGAVGLSTFPF
jgi:hypothetical protein